MMPIYRPSKSLRSFALRNLIDCALVVSIGLASIANLFGPSNAFGQYGGLNYPNSTPNGFAPNPGMQPGSPYSPLQNGVVAPAQSGGVYQPMNTGAQDGFNAYNAAPNTSGNPTPSAGVPAGGGPYVGSPVAYAAQQPPTGQTNYPNQPMRAPGPMNQPLPPLNVPWQIDSNPNFLGATPDGYNPAIRTAPVHVYAQEGQTGRISVGGSVNSDLGVSGQVIVEERNFDIFGWPDGRTRLWNGAFRGAGQNFRMELMPGNQVQRYTVNWTEPNLFGYSPFSFSVGGFYFTRFYDDWSEQRLGGRIALGYEISPELSLTTELSGQDVKIFNPSTNSLPALNRVLGSNDLFKGSVRLAHNTRDNPFLPTEGHLFEAIYDQNFGEFDFPRAQLNFSKYFTVRQRPAGDGRHTFTSAFRLGFSGEDTPIFENFFAGGYSTLRGFAFRGAGPVEQGVQTGGRFQFLGSFEYMMPLTADDMLRMVAFVDYGTIEQDIEVNWENFRVAPGVGFRVSVPALGPAPLAFDFAFPVAHADDDSRQVFSFSMGMVR